MVQAIYYPAESRQAFLFIHGYTGSPTDFNTLPKILHQKFGQEVSVPLLPGHGTVISDLDGLSFEHFLQPIEKELMKLLQQGKKVNLLGICFGGHLALHLAARYPVESVISISTPYRWRFPINLPGIHHLGKIKKYWKKRLSEDERQRRREAFHYPQAHRDGFALVNEANRRVNPLLPKITCPVLIIHSINDTLGHVQGAYRLLDEVSSMERSISIFTNKNHNIFFSPDLEKIGKRIEQFYERQPEKTAAIVCAYNEGSRISQALSTLTSCPFLDEIIMVDDGYMENCVKWLNKKAILHIQKCVTFSTNQRISLY